MRVVLFITLIVFSYALTTSGMSYFGDEAVTSEKIKSKSFWPPHWEKEGELNKQQKFVAYYSPFNVEEESNKSLMHFRSLGYDAIKEFDQNRNEALIYTLTQKSKVIITIKNDELERQGSNITTVIIPKSQKKEDS